MSITNLFISIITFSSLIILSMSYGIKRYPVSHIQQVEKTNKIVYRFPHCDSRYCKTYITPNDTLKIISKYPFYLDYTIKIQPYIDRSGIRLSNNIEEMLLYLPKKPDNYNTLPSIEPEEPPVIPKGIEIIDIPSQEDYPKNADAAYGYYNFQNKWINY